MPPEYLKIFLANPDLVDAFLGEYEDEGGGELTTEELIAEFSQDPNALAVLEAADLIAA
jgi:hypothetical protein